MTNAIALKIYESKVASKGENFITGLHYKKQGNENPTITNSLTTCVRFNLKRLGNSLNPGHKDNRAPLILIPGNNETYFLGIGAGYPISVIIFNKKITVLRDPDSSSYLIFKLYTWHHICFSYSEQNSQIRFVKVNSTNCTTPFKVQFQHR